MIVKIFPAGKSFVGVGRYLSHDAAKKNDAGKIVHPTTSERVAFTATRNCISEDADSAMREMWRTAEDQNFLQKQAGAKISTCKTPVKHMVLSWPEGVQPTHEHMQEAADDFLLSMGWSAHQAVYYAHTDTENAHLHIVLNQVHPEHGRTLKSGHEKNKAQAWARNYEREHGGIQCTARVDKDYSAPRGPKNPAPPTGVERDGQAQEKPFIEKTATLEASDKPDRDMLIKRHRQERDDYFKAAKPEFAAARKRAYQETKEQFAPAWQDYFDSAKLLRRQARLLSRWNEKRAFETAARGDFGEAWKVIAGADIKDGFNPVELVEQRLKAARQEIANKQAEVRREKQQEACDTLFLTRGHDLIVMKERQAEERAELSAIAKAHEAGKPVDLDRLNTLLHGNRPRPTDPNQLMRDLAQANDNAKPLQLQPVGNDNKAPQRDSATAHGAYDWLEPAISPLYDPTSKTHAMAEGLRAMLHPDSPFQILFRNAQQLQQTAREEDIRRREDRGSARLMTQTASMDNVQMDALEKLQKRAERAEQTARLGPSIANRATEKRRNDTERER